MRAGTVDYRADNPDDRSWFNRGVYLLGAPRLTVWCNLLGHVPVVDGAGTWKQDTAGGERYGNPRRHVACGRCRERPDPAGDLDPDLWDVGDPYTGGLAVHGPAMPQHPVRAVEHLAQLRQAGFYPPGQWARRGRTNLSAQLTVGGPWRRLCRGVWGVEVSLGAAGDDDAVSIAVQAGHLAQLFVSFGKWGTWIRRRFNRTGRHALHTALQAAYGRLYWKVLAPDAEGGRRPRWRDGSVPIDPVAGLLGARRYEDVDTGGRATVSIRLADGFYPVKLKLYQRTDGRKRGLKRRSWSVSWHIPDGIPTGTLQGNHASMCGSSVTVDDAAVAAGTWPDEAAAAITVDVLRFRTSQGWPGTGLKIAEPAAVWRLPADARDSAKK